VSAILQTLAVDGAAAPSRLAGIHCGFNRKPELYGSISTFPAYTYSVQLCPGDTGKKSGPAGDYSR